MKSTRPESYHEVNIILFVTYRQPSLIQRLTGRSCLCCYQCELCQHPYLFTRSGWMRALDSEMFILFVTAIFFAILLLTGNCILKILLPKLELNIGRIGSAVWAMFARIFFLCSGEPASSFRSAFANYQLICSPGLKASFPPGSTSAFSGTMWASCLAELSWPNWALSCYR